MQLQTSGDLLQAFARIILKKKKQISAVYIHRVVCVMVLLFLTFFRIFLGRFRIILFRIFLGQFRIILFSDHFGTVPHYTFFGSFWDGSALYFFRIFLGRLRIILFSDRPYYVQSKSLNTHLFYKKGYNWTKRMLVNFC